MIIFLQEKENIIPQAQVLNLIWVTASALNYDIMKNADTVFLLAAKARVQPSILNPVEYEINNTLGVVNILKSAIEAGVRRADNSASSSAYGNSEVLPLKENFNINPLSPYGAQKYYGEVLCKMFSQVYNIETVSLRYFNVYGERQNIDGAYALMVVFLFIKDWMDCLWLLEEMENKKEILYVGDVVDANLLASISKNVGTEEIN